MGKKFKKNQSASSIRSTKFYLFVLLLILLLVVSVNIVKAYKRTQLPDAKVLVTVHSCTNNTGGGRYNLGYNSCNVYEEGETKLHILPVPLADYAATNDKIHVFKSSSGSYSLSKSTTNNIAKAVYYSLWIAVILFLFYYFHRKNSRRYEPVKTKPSDKVHLRLQNKAHLSSAPLKTAFVVIFLLVFMPFIYILGSNISASLHSLWRVRSSNPSEVKVKILDCYEVRNSAGICRVELRYTGETKIISVDAISKYQRGDMVQMFEFSDGELEETRHATWAKKALAFNLGIIALLIGVGYLSFNSENIIKQKEKRRQKRALKSEKKPKQ